MVYVDDMRAGFGRMVMSHMVALRTGFYAGAISLPENPPIPSGGKPMSDSPTIKGFKGFDDKFRCRDFQFEVGKTYEHSGPVSLCHSGFHFCENPLDIFGYYPPTGKFAEVEAGEVDDQKDSDSKRVAKRLTISAELSLTALLGLGAKFILDKVDFANAKESNTGYRSAATNTGYRSAATNTGTQSAATNTGTQSAATNTGDEGCAISLGIGGKARGAKGCWLTLAEWKEKDNEWHRVDVRTVIVDGKIIKADTLLPTQARKVRHG